MQELLVGFRGWGDPLEKGMQLTAVFLPGELHGQRSTKVQLSLIELYQQPKNVNHMLIQS